eukprot:3417256-Rhodomonas_salina.1
MKRVLHTEKADGATVLRERMLLRACYEKSSTEPSYGGTPSAVLSSGMVVLSPRMVVRRYAKCSTELAYGGTEL